ncbi:hypothetical protein F1880_003751 [Penicillium rolfsii]|nr:hypothetical protein F1880_003751 [Penicillium rolfsii]
MHAPLDCLVFSNIPLDQHRTRHSASKLTQFYKATEESRPEALGSIGHGTKLSAAVPPWVRNADLKPFNKVI